MRILTSTSSPAAINAGLLILRVGIATLLLPGGYQKIANFATIKTQFVNFLGLGPTVSLALCIFAEFFCSLLILAGLFTRLATIPLIINFLVIIFMAGAKDLWGKDQHVALYLLVWITLLLTGAGRYSVDGSMRK
jgi:putative oxidoreductase